MIPKFGARVVVGTACMPLPHGCLPTKRATSACLSVRQVEREAMQARLRALDRSIGSIKERSYLEVVVGPDGLLRYKVGGDLVDTGSEVCPFCPPPWLSCPLAFLTCA